MPGNVRGGEQEVKVYGDDDDLNTTSATAMVTITALPLDVSPSDGGSRTPGDHHRLRLRQ